MPTLLNAFKVRRQRQLAVSEATMDNGDSARGGAVAAWVRLVQLILRLILTGHVVMLIGSFAWFLLRLLDLDKLLLRTALAAGRLTRRWLIICTWAMPILAAIIWQLLSPSRSPGELQPATAVNGSLGDWTAECWCCQESCSALNEGAWECSYEREQETILHIQKALTLPSDRIQKLTQAYVDSSLDVLATQEASRTLFNDMRARIVPQYLAQQRSQPRSPSSAVDAAEHVALQATLAALQGNVTACERARDGMMGPHGTRRALGSAILSVRGEVERERSHRDQLEEVYGVYHLQTSFPKNVFSEDFGKLLDRLDYALEALGDLHSSRVSGLGSCISSEVRGMKQDLHEYGGSAGAIEDMTRLERKRLIWPVFCVGSRMPRDR